MSRLTLALGVALLAVEASLAIVILTRSDSNLDRWPIIGLAVVAGAAFVLSGLVALTLRPENRTGIYLAATGYLWFLSALQDSTHEWVFTIGFVLGNLVWVPFTALVLAYPTGRLETRLERAVPIAVGAVLLLPALLAALIDPSPSQNCDSCPDSAIAVADWPDAGAALDAVATIGGLGLVALVVGILVRRWRRASPALRRLLRPVAGAGIAALLAVALVIVTDPVSHTAARALTVLFFAAFAAVPLAFLYGILHTRLARSSVSDVVVALQRGVPIRDALADALGDPSLSIVYPLDARWVDDEGRNAEYLLDRPDTVITPVEAGGEVVAGLVHDTALAYERSLLEGVVGATALVLRAQGLQAEAKAQFTFLRTLVETAPSLFIHLATDGRIKNQNAAAVEAAGYDDEEIVRGRFFWDVFIGPEERDEVIARFEALAPTFAAGEYENTFTNARGEERTINWRAAPLVDERGRTLSIIAGGVDITERRRRELELQRERDATTTVLETIPSIVVVLGRDGLIRDRDVDNPNVGANRAFQGALGWRDDELVGRAFVDLIAEDDDGRASAALTAAATGVSSSEVESELRCADGSVRAFAWSAVPVADVTGRTDALVLVSGVEITERRRLEAEKERERRFLNAIANNAPSLICIVDHEGRVTERGVNRAFERTLEWDDDAVGGKVFWEHWVDPDEAAEVRSRIERVVAGETVGEHDNRWVARSGHRLTIAWTCTPLPQIDERTLFLLSGTDVTERKRREEEIRAGQERFRAVIESAPVAIVEIGLDSNVNLWNPAAERIFGWSQEEVLGRPPPTIPADRQDEFRELTMLEASGGAYTGFETVRLHRDGTLLDVEISAAPIRDATGAVMGAMAVLSDISDRKRQDEQLRASRARIVTAGDEARQRLERNLHDGAQQRLVALSIALRLAETKLSEDPAAAASVLAAAREELALALEELRELARGIHPAVLTDRGLRPALEALAARAPLPVDLDAPPVRLAPDAEAAAYYVVAEALTNIAKYAQASSALVRAEAANGMLRVTVADDGIGGADPRRGSGLRGLTDRVEALDGRLRVDSPPGEGTTVVAEIPLHQPVVEGHPGTHT